MLPLGQKKKKRIILSHKLLSKKLNTVFCLFVCLFCFCCYFFIFRKWAMRNAGILFYSVLANFFFLFWPFRNQFFSFFSWQLKNTKKFTLAHRALRQKWVHMSMRVGLWDKPFFVGLSDCLKLYLIDCLTVYLKLFCFTWY